MQWEGIYFYARALHAATMTGGKGKGELPISELWTKLLSYRYQILRADVGQAGWVPGLWEVFGKTCLAFSCAPGCEEV